MTVEFVSETAGDRTSPISGLHSQSEADVTRLQFVAGLYEHKVEVVAVNHLLWVTCIR